MQDIRDDSEQFSEWFHKHRRQIQVDLFAGTVSGMFDLKYLKFFKLYLFEWVANGYDQSSQVVMETWKNEGFLAFFKGMQFPLIAVPVINACVFSVYEFWKRLLHTHSDEKFPVLKIILNGFCAGLAVSFISSPVELVKIRLQAQHEVILKGPYDVIKQIYQREGIKGLYRGWFSTMIRETQGYAAQFVLYEYIQHNIRYNYGRHPNNLEILISGGLGGMFGWIIIYPQDSIKTHLQMETIINPHERKYKISKIIRDGGFIDCAKQVLQQEGFQGLWKGIINTCFRGFFSTSIGFYGYEITKNLLDLQVKNKIF